MERTNNWLNNIENLIDESKKVILIAGASSSGKSYNAECLQKYLTSQGKRVCILSADHYYKGLTRIILQKALINQKNIADKYFSDSQTTERVYNIIRNTIEHKDFPDKFNQHTINTLKNKFAFLNEDKMTFINELEHQYKNMDFDQPFCINFELLKNHINMFIKGESFTRPEYSFKTSESIFDDKNIIKSDKNDLIIVEGLYTLTNQLLSELNKQNIITTFIDCDLKTLVSRKFNRDINLNRSTFTPEQTIISAITQTLPAYYKYILPTKKSANIILDTSITQKEVLDKKENVQVKFKVINDGEQFLQRIGYHIDKIENHTDYFLEAVNGNDNMFVRLRTENNLASELEIKIKKDSFKTANQKYSLKDFDYENKQVEFLIEAFKKSGFKIDNMMSKTRCIYTNGQNKIKYDKTPFGDFIEIDKKDLKQIKEIKPILSKPIDKSYYALSCSSAIEHYEIEKKYLLKGQINLKNFESEKINQYYFNIENHKNLLNNIFKKVNLKDYNEMRIRKIANKYYLTLKSKGGKVRKELEKQVPFQTFEDISPSAIGVIEKTRYFIYKNDCIDVTLDVYNDKNILEIETNQLYSNKDGQILSKVLKMLGENVTAEDVTGKKEYKNSELARKL